MDDFTKAAIQLLFLLPLVLVLAYVSLKYGLGRIQHSPSASHMEIIDRLSLGPKTGLFVVRIAEEYLLIAVSGERIQVLKELPDYPKVEKTFRSDRPSQVVSQVQQVLAAKFGKRGRKS